MGATSPHPVSTAPGFDVFVSYSHADKDWVRDWLVPRLRDAGLSVCIDVDNFGLGKGATKEMALAVKASAKTLCVFTPEYVESRWCEYERDLANHLSAAERVVRVVPLLLKDCEIPWPLDTLLYADFTREADWERQIGRVIAHIRGEETAVATARSGGLLPLPPQPYFAHPYPLQAHFTGRRSERRALTDWLSGGAQSLFAYVALGGFGKSALTWAWVQRDVLGFPLPGLPADPCDGECRIGEDLKPEGVLWWSFYEREAKFDAFLREALVYCSGGRIDPQSLGSDHERVVALVSLLQQHRFLLVLDGFERELRAYGSLNASYQGDEVAEEAKGDHRACLDPRAADFLRRIAALSLESRVLMTTRLYPKELEGHGGAMLPRCRRENLIALQPDDAVAFFHAQGIQGNRGEIEAVCRSFGFHPLALRLLAGMILRDPQRPGDIRAAEEYDPGDELVAREHHVLQLAYDALRPELRELLSRLAAFRGPMDYEAVRAISPLDNETELKAALRELTERGLLVFDGAAARYDLHPIVRHHAYNRLTDKEGVHTRLHGYFDAVPKPDKVERIEDLAPVIELYHHTVRAGRYDDACDLYYDRLSKPLHFQFGAYETVIELLRALFPDGEGKVPRLKNESGQAWTLNELAISYGCAGQPRRAAPLQETVNEILRKRDDSRNLATGLRNLADSQLALGELAAAEANLRRSIPLSEESVHEFGTAVGHQDLGLLLACEGAVDEAAAELDAAFSAFGNRGLTQSRAVVQAHRALRALLMSDAVGGLHAARSARQLAEETARTRYPHERDFVQAEWLLGWAHVALAAEGKDEREQHLAEAERHLTDALTRCRKINLVEFEPDILLGWARWHRLEGNADEARRQAEEALHIADRCEYRLKQADIHNLLARLDLDVGQREAAVEHARTAYKRAWCDGPPHCYKPALEEAQALLDELGVEPPKLTLMR